MAAENGIVFNWQKCQFLQNEMEFLGHVIGQSTISPSPEKIRAVSAYPVPQNVKQIQGFLGLTGREGYATISLPLTKLMKKDAGFVFGVKEN